MFSEWALLSYFWCKSASTSQEDPFWTYTLQLSNLFLDIFPLAFISPVSSPPHLFNSAPRACYCPFCSTCFLKCPAIEQWSNEASFTLCPLQVPYLSSLFLLQDNRTVLWNTGNSFSSTDVENASKHSSAHSITVSFHLQNDSALQEMPSSTRNVSCSFQQELPMGYLSMAAAPTSQGDSSGSSSMMHTRVWWRRFQALALSLTLCHS